MVAEDGVDAGQVDRVEVRPMGRGPVGRRERVPGDGEGEAVAGQQALGQGIVRDLVVGTGDRLHPVAQIQGGADPQ